MKKLNSFLIILLIIFTTCKTKNDEQPNDPNNNASPMAKSLEIFMAAENEFLSVGESLNLSPQEALGQIVDFVSALDGVKSVDYLDGHHLRIFTDDQIVTSITINETDENGMSIYRGGPGGTHSLISSKGDCANEIENKKVLLYAAAHDDFYSGNYFDYYVVGKIETGDVDVEITTLKNEQCTPEVFKTLDQYGFIIMDTHGQPDMIRTGVGFNLIEAEIPGSVDAFLQILESKIGTTYVNQIVAGQLSLGKEFKYNPSLQNELLWQEYKKGLSGSYHVWVTSKGIRDFVPNLMQTVIFANTCYSGFQSTYYEPTKTTYDPIQPAWISKEPIAFYGYEAAQNKVSYEAGDQFCKRNADTLIYSFFREGDSTGNAHLFGNNINSQPWANYYGWKTNEGPLNFNLYGANNWCYGSCGSDFTDKRDGQKYKTVCIGNQRWMAENLNYDTVGGHCYDNNPTLCDSLGKLYEWATAEVVCPEGWHLPTDTEWNELIEYLGGVQVAGGKMKATHGWDPPNTGASNESGFSALGAGKFYTATMTYGSIGEVSTFWADTENPNPVLEGFIELYNAYTEVGVFGTNIDIVYRSVRCVKDQ